MALERARGGSLNERRRADGARLAGRRVLVSALVLLLLLVGVGSSRNAAAAPPEAPEDVTAFSYELYCDAQGRFTYDGAALKLVKRPAHLERVYADAGGGDARAKELVRELERWFYQAGVVVADTTTRPACLPLPELTPECQPNWQFLKEFLGDTHEAERLRQVVAHAYEMRTRERGLQNKVIVAGVNLLLARGMAKGLMTQATTAEARGAAGQVLTTEARVAQAAGRSGVAAGGGGDVVRLYHGSVGNYSSILKSGLDPARSPTWVTTSRAAAENAIGPGRVLSPGQGLDRGIIESVVPRTEFDRLIQSGGISPTRTWPGFGGGQVFPENVLRSPEAIELFNKGIVP